jgi:hypothetical protein
MNTNTTLDLSADLIDSRDIIARFEELQDELDNLKEIVNDIAQQIEDAESEELKQDLSKDLNFATSDITTWNEENLHEYQMLENICKEGADNASDWIHGETLIREDYFVDYTEDLINDCYELPKGIDSGEWPFRHMKMNYEDAADEMKYDYTTIEIDGSDYYIRAC